MGADIIQILRPPHGLAASRKFRAYFPVKILGLEKSLQAGKLRLLFNRCCCSSQFLSSLPQKKGENKYQNQYKKYVF